MKKFFLFFVITSTMIAEAEITNSSVTVKSLLGKGFAIPLVVEGYLVKNTNVLDKGESITCANVKLVDNGVEVRTFIPLEYFTTDIQEKIETANNGAFIKVVGFESLKVEGMPAAIGEYVLLPQCKEWSVLPCFVIAKIFEIELKKFNSSESSVSVSISATESRSMRQRRPNSLTNSALLGTSIRAPDK
jgi:hypothetical protein